MEANRKRRSCDGCRETARCDRVGRRSDPVRRIGECIERCAGQQLGRVGARERRGNGEQRQRLRLLAEGTDRFLDEGRGQEIPPL